MVTASFVRKIKDVDVIVWDKANMSSSRMLELVNCLHHKCTLPPVEWCLLSGVVCRQVSCLLGTNQRAGRNWIPCSV